MAMAYTLLLLLLVVCAGVSVQAQLSPTDGWVLVDSADSNALAADMKYPILAHDQDLNSLFIYYSCDSCYQSSRQYTNYLSRLDLASLTLDSNYPAPNVKYFDRPWNFYCQMNETWIYFRTLASNNISRLNVKTREIDNDFLPVPTALIDEFWFTPVCDASISPNYLFLITFYNAGFYIYDFEAQTWTTGSVPRSLSGNFQPVILNQDHLYYTQSTAGTQIEIDYLSLTGDIASNSFLQATGTNQIVRVYECAFNEDHNANYIHFIGGRYNANPFYDAQIYQIYDISNGTFMTAANQLNFNRDHIGCISINGVHLVFGGSTYIAGDSVVTDLNTWEYFITNNSDTFVTTMPSAAPTSSPSGTPVTPVPTSETLSPSNVPTDMPSVATTPINFCQDLNQSNFTGWARNLAINKCELCLCSEVSDDEEGVIVVDNNGNVIKLAPQCGSIRTDIPVALQNKFMDVCTNLDCGFDQVLPRSIEEFSCDCSGFYCDFGFPSESSRPLPTTTPIVMVIFSLFLYSL